MFINVYKYLHLKGAFIYMLAVIKENYGST
ncbi:hypothetical protein KCTC32420_00014 [Aequorivita nionensis]